MSEIDRDPRVSERYLELGAEEPPHALDAAILAAARREVEARPAPLVAPTGRRRWYMPLAAAAVIVLSVAVTFHMQLEEPGMDGVVQPAETTPAAAPPAPARAPEPMAMQEAAPKASAAPVVKPAAPVIAEARRFAADPAPRAAANKAQASVESLAKAEMAASAERPPAEVAAAITAAKPAAPAARAAAIAPAPALERDELRRERTDRVAAMELRAKRVAEAPESPEKALERIADLRRAGRHDEADKALAEFRKRHPDYKIPEAMLERVERR